MATVKTISELYAKHEHSFIKHLKRAKNLEEKEVHKLRVEIKNLRALFEFLQALSDKKLKFSALQKLLTPLFKKAGKIRTAQLNLSMTRSYRSATMIRFREHLQKEEEKAGKRFLKLVKEFDTDKLEKLHQKNLKAVKKFKTGDLDADFESFFRNIFAKIRTAMFDMNKDEVLHEIRKYLKTIKNTGKLMKELKRATILQEELKKVEAVYDKIGKWHDGLVLAETFEAYVRKKEIAEVQEKALAFVLSLKEKSEKTKLLLIKKLKTELA